MPNIEDVIAKREVFIFHCLLKTKFFLSKASIFYWKNLVAVEIETVPQSFFVIRLSLPQIVNALFTLSTIWVSFHLKILRNVSILRLASKWGSRESAIVRIPPTKVVHVRIPFQLRVPASLLFVLVVPEFSMQRAVLRLD